MLRIPIGLAKMCVATGENGVSEFEARRGFGFWPEPTLAPDPSIRPALGAAKSNAQADAYPSYAALGTVARFRSTCAGVKSRTKPRFGTVFTRAAYFGTAALIRSSSFRF